VNEKSKQSPFDLPSLILGQQFPFNRFILRKKRFIKKPSIAERKGKGEMHLKGFTSRCTTFEIPRGKKNLIGN